MPETEKTLCRKILFKSLPSRSQYRQYVQAWQLGNKDGSRGIRARTISRHLVRFLTEKYGEKCSLCGWDKRHPKTGRVPLEIDHANGNSENNVEENLRLICPNCHSLTLNFRNLYKGNGRAWRSTHVGRVVETSAIAYSAGVAQR